jgi:hypothetical protein
MLAGSGTDSRSSVSPDSSTGPDPKCRVSEPHPARRRPRTHHAATIAVGTAHPAKPAAATVHIPCVSYTPFGTTVAVMPAEMSPRIAQPTRTIPQRSRRSIWGSVVVRAVETAVLRDGHPCAAIGRPGSPHNV